MLPNTDDKRVAIVGSGHMGTAIATKLLQQKVSVLLIDSERRALKRAEDKLAAGMHREMATRLAVTTDLSRAACAWLVFEAIPEDLRLKQAVFEKLEAHVSQDCLLCSNTSGLPIGAIARKLPSSTGSSGHTFSRRPTSFRSWKW